MLHRKIGWMLLCSAVLLASCNDDETNGNGGNGPAVPPAEVTADVDYEVFGGEDMPQLFDMQAKYTDAVGKTVTADVACLLYTSCTARNLPSRSFTSGSATNISGHAAGPAGFYFSGHPFCRR